MSIRIIQGGPALPFILICFFLTSSQPVPAEGEGRPGPLRLVAYNIKHGRGMDNKVDLGRVAEVLRGLNPDLVALQEIDWDCSRSGEVDQAAALGKLLGMKHSFGKFMNFQGGQYGLAVLSRFPIQKAIRHQLAPGAEPRCALEIIIRPAESAPLLSFVSIHNDWTREPFRVAQVNDLIRGLAERRHPVVLAGDFNAEPGADSLLRLVKAGFTFLAKENNAKTFPAPDPRIEIDYFATRGIPSETLPLSRVHDERVASDHRPILVDLHFTNSARSGQ
ncbi:MAG: endonuclease [Verrucomicrobiaceae bacterium]|nr:endonuclease [Verrucomicrobiaceae bacterium]